MEPTRPDGAATRQLERRRFLRRLIGFSVLSSAAMILTPVLAFLVPPLTQGTGGGAKVSAGKLAELPPDGGKVVPMGSKPVILVNAPAGPVAFSAICPHLGCIVAWDPAAKNIVCPCHDGRFNPATGAVIGGPPPAPLPPVKVSVEGDEIFLLPS